MADAAAGATGATGAAGAAGATGAAAAGHHHHAALKLTQFSQHSWNVFRYLGDYIHLGGVVVLLATIGSRKSVAGISKGTQMLYFLVFVSRYLDLIDHSQTTYLVFFKLTFILTSCVVLGLFHAFDATYERRHDTCNLPVLILPCATAAILLTDEYSMLEILWTFSEFLEGFAMVPQYVFCYREQGGGKDMGPVFYVICLGSYRVFYALNWIYKKWNMPHYSDMQSWLGGVIEILFFVDFLNFRFTGSSMLRSMVLTVDTKINEITDKVEMKVLGSSSALRAAESEGSEMRRRRRADDDRVVEDV